MSDERRANLPGLPQAQPALLDHPTFANVGNIFGLGNGDVVMITGFTTDGLSAKWNAPVVIPLASFEALCQNGLATVAKIKELQSAAQREPGHG